MINPPAGLGESFTSYSLFLAFDRTAVVFNSSIGIKEGAVYWKGVILMIRKVLSVMLVIAAVIFVFVYSYPRTSLAQQPKKFTDSHQLAEYVRNNSRLASMLYGGIGFGGARSTALMLDDRASAPEAGAPAQMKAAPLREAVDGDSHSSTNVQVKGVDEADIFKNDGKYLYVASENQVHIMEAYPSDKARLVSSIKCQGYVAEMLLNKDRIMIISHRDGARGMAAEVYDIADRSKPSLVKTLSWGGGYVSSRMIASNVYLVLNYPVYFKENPSGGDAVNLPEFTENDVKSVIPPEDIYYFDFTDYSYNYTMIVSVNIEDEKQNAWRRTYLTGVSQNIYCSLENLYLSGPKAPDIGLYTGRLLEGMASLVDGDAAGRIRKIAGSSERPELKIQQAEQVLEGYMAGMDYAGAVALEEKIRLMMEKFNRDLARERNKTAIYKFSIMGAGVEYKCRGEVEGNLLNQFSMDEEGGYFRVATTSRGFLFDGRTNTRNNVYIMDEGLNVVGKLEGLAPRERIFSARFLGGRLYLVTFRNIDPLFVIDIADPKNPKVLGELKIPGFSDYLHPYDENHIIGIGKEVAPVPEPVPLPVDPMLRMPEPEIMPPAPPVIQQGVKIALFDVSDPARPVEKARYVVDQVYSDSEVSRNHKAFLFSRSKNIMALPVSYPENISGGMRKMPYYGHWQGMYVFNISPENGIKLKGKVAHTADGINPYERLEQVRRAAYINDVFYTVSNRSVKLSRLEDLKEIKTIRLPASDYTPQYIKKLAD